MESVVKDDPIIPAEEVKNIFSIIGPNQTPFL